MQRSINLYPVGIAFLLSAVVVLCFRISLHEQSFVKDITITAQNMIPKEILGHQDLQLEIAHTPKYAASRLKGIVYNSDNRIDRWMDEASKVTMPR